LSIKICKSCGITKDFSEFYVSPTNSDGRMGKEEFDALCSVFGYACLCCGVTGQRLEADHVVPLTKGGSDDISNIQPLCGVCNRRKFTAVIDYRLQVLARSV
jgi:5-methylcytosine-specific restriction endonuclease McrA